VSSSFSPLAQFHALCRFRAHLRRHDENGNRALSPAYRPSWDLTRVSAQLLREKVRGKERLEALLELLEENEEVQDYLELCNEMVVKRLYYNDHGPCTRG